MDKKYKKIFVCGVHGVGKSTFLREFAETQEHSVYECSQLIKKYSGLEFKEKQIDNIQGNQSILLSAVNHFVKEENVVFDGHIVLFTKDKEIQIVDSNVISDLQVEKIIFLKASPDLILSRIRKRDSKTWLTADFIEEAQKIELDKVIEYSERLEIDYTVYEWCPIVDGWNKKKSDFCFRKK